MDLHQVREHFRAADEPFRFDAPRDDLVRMARGVELRAEGDGRLLHGYAAVFNDDTIINSWEGQFVERLAPGAFAKTLKERGDQVKVLFDHGYDPQIGDKPLGKASVMKEDKKGLYVEVPLSRTSYNDDLIALLDDGAIDGMSFRFSVQKETWEEPGKAGELPVRTIHEVKLYEFGPVTFPAYEATTAGVRSRDEFTVWRSLPDAKRDAIRQIIGTPNDAAGSSTAPEGAASTTTDEPGLRAGNHSQRTTTRQRLLRVKDIHQVPLAPERQAS